MNNTNQNPKTKKRSFLRRQIFVWKESYFPTRRIFLKTKVAYNLWPIHYLTLIPDSFSKKRKGKKQSSTLRSNQPILWHFSQLNQVLFILHFYCFLVLTSPVRWPLWIESQRDIQEIWWGERKRFEFCHDTQIHVFLG